jgi:DNA-directed RNA polymerase specialized sigma24 family protein
MDNLDSSTVLRWLESPCLARIASRVASHYGLPAQDSPDLLQDLRLALWAAGSDTVVNATWVFHTANHKAVDLVRRRIRAAREAIPLAEDPPLEDAADPALLHLLRARAALLPRKIHDFYTLRYEEGLSQREIARRLGNCRGSVRCLDRQCLRMVKGPLARKPPLFRLSS